MEEEKRNRIFKVVVIVLRTIMKVFKSLISKDTDSEKE